MIRMGATREVRNAVRAGASRTARAAIGFEELLAGDVEAMRTAQWRYARRQLTWLRKMKGVELIDRTGREDTDVAAEIAIRLAPG
jgi:tRNA dimethylallyltransferase